VHPEDFRVEEIPAYLPSGRGEHIMCQIRKRGRSTDEVLRALSRHTGLSPGQFGSAGLKDRHAETIQWLSVPAQAKQRGISPEEVVRDVMMGTSRIKEMMSPIEVANLFLFGFSRYARYLVGGDLLFDGGVVLTY